MNPQMKFRPWLNSTGEKGFNICMFLSFNFINKIDRAGRKYDRLFSTIQRWI